MAESKIEWTGQTLNPIRAQRKDNGRTGTYCQKVSPGCKNCYAESFNGRCLPRNGTGLEYTVPNADLVDIYLDDEILRQPLRRTKPTTYFVCSMTDLFGDFVPDELIDYVFAMMAVSGGHTFQVLTKRADRMQRYMARLSNSINPIETAARAFGCTFNFKGIGLLPWPIPNIWLGVSVENQQYADERIPLLLDTPAAVRFISYEPALGPVDFMYPSTIWPGGPPMCCNGQDCGCYGSPVEPPLIYGIDWVIVGGESGPGARFFDVSWANSVVRQCNESGVAVFVKQLGRLPVDSDGCAINLSDKKGGDMSEWPEGLRVREYPKVRR